MIQKKIYINPSKTSIAKKNPKQNLRKKWVFLIFNFFRYVYFVGKLELFHFKFFLKNKNV
jgi:hypothetical protein